MRKKLAVLMAAALGIGLVAFLSSAEIARGMLQQDGGNSFQELQKRVGKLETQVTALQKQLKELESRRVLTIPGSQLPQGSAIPPGSRPYKFNGQTYWYVPLHSDRQNPNK
jgi:hypothetical protein